MSLIAKFGADFLSVAVMMLICFAIGRPLVSVFPSSVFSWKYLVTPVLGFGWTCVLGTVLYRFGVSPFGSLILVLLIGTAALVFYGPADVARLQRATNVPAERQVLTVLIFVAVLAILPSTVGGPQFSVFQGNPFDQMNYIAISVTASLHPYVSLPDIIRASEPHDDFTKIGAYLLLNFRPSVSVGYEILRQAIFGYAYNDVPILMGTLQILVFLALTFLSVNVVRLPLMLSTIIGAAGALGFFTQYVIDINAWSHLASLSSALVVLTVLIGVFSPHADDRAAADFSGNSSKAITAVSLTRGGLLIMIALVPLVYLYPEMLALAAPATAVALVALLLTTKDKRLFAGSLACLVLGIGLSLVWALEYWNATIGSLTSQLRLATHVPLPAPPYVNPTVVGVENNWHQYYQRYIFDPMVSEDHYRGAYAILSAPVDFAYGLLGVYFLRPPPSLARWARLAWKLGLLVPLATSVCAIALAMIRTFARNGDLRHRSLCTLAVALAAIVLCIALSGLYWTAGKGVAMIAPIFLVVMAIPLERRLVTLYGLCFLGLIAAHIAFGVARPIASATTLTGIHYQFPPYPGVHDAAIKTTQSWDISVAISEAKHCRLVSVDIDQPILDSFIQMALTEHQVAWSSLRPINGYYGMGKDFGQRHSDERSDCLLTLTRDANDVRKRVVTIRQHINTSLPPNAG